MKCKICGNEAKKQFERSVLQKIKVSFFRCPHCLFLQTEKPYWLSESYKEPINVTDTGYVTRNVYLAKKALVLFFSMFRCKGAYVDFAGGHGILTRLMRDYGLDYYWDDLYTPNLFAQGFKMKENVQYTAGTCFECFEHFNDPIPEIERILAHTDTLFFSTMILPEKLPAENWEYYSFGHGQHIAFYSIKTFEYIAQKYNLNYRTNGVNLHLLTKKKISNQKFNFLMSLSRLPVDLIIKKLFLKTRMIEDQKRLKEAGFN